MDSETRIRHIEGTFTTLQNQLDALADDIQRVAEDARVDDQPAIYRQARLVKNLLKDVEQASLNFDSLMAGER